MSSVPGYNPLGVGGNLVSYPSTNLVSYPSTYQGVKGYSSASPAVPQGNVTFRAQPGAGDKKRNKGSGRNLPKTLRVFTCADKHPIQALKELRADAQFEVMCTYQTNTGAAIVVNTTIDKVVYQGEGISGQIARTIAAHKALMGMNAADHSMLKQVVDYEEQKKLVMERISIWQEMQAKKEEKRLEHEKLESEAVQKKADRKLNAEENKTTKENEPKQATKKKKKNNGTSSAVEGAMFLDYGHLIQKYGPDVSETTTQLEEKTDAGWFQFKCVLSVQGFSFESTCTSKKGARNKAVDLAHAEFTVHPPPVVNEKKRKLPNNKRSAEGEEPIEPVEFQDKLAEKCWKFVSEQTEAIIPALKTRRNLVVVVKVEGKDELESCEIVSFGSGTLLIKKENMTCDGTVINDSTGESLALRAFRRYLLDQVEMCLTGKTSIYTKDRTGGKCSLKKAVKFYLYTNSCPMGDCRAVNTQPLTEQMETDTEQSTEPTSEVNPEPMETGDSSAKPLKTKNWVPRKKCELENLGKITFFLANCEFGSSETTALYSEEKSHCVVSPSDKLAVRQVSGVQGSILFSVSSPVYISHYFINRSFNEPAISRALNLRVKGAKIPSGKDAPVQPQFTKVAWKATRIAEKRTKWGLIWAKNHEVEILYTPQGKQFHKDKQEDVETALQGDLTQFFAPSEYCTKALFTAYVNVCKKTKKAYPQKYSVAKSANTRYRQVKTSVLSHLKDSGFGDWSVNPCKPDY